MEISEQQLNDKKPEFIPAQELDGGVKVLAVYKGYTVDYRLKQFRKVKGGDHGMIEFVDFASEKGDKLLSQMIRKGYITRDEMY